KRQERIVHLHILVQLQGLGISLLLHEIEQLHCLLHKRSQIVLPSCISLCSDRSDESQCFFIRLSHSLAICITHAQIYLCTCMSLFSSKGVELCSFFIRLCNSIAFLVTKA